jgi:hypothetical protein
MKIVVNETKTVDNYPYGRLKTTAYFSLEFQKNKGFRSVFQTVNPKTGVLNKPKKGVYNDIMFMTDTDGFIKFCSMSFYDIKKLHNITAFLDQNFALFTVDQIRYMYARVITFLKIELHSLKVYCNVDTAQSLPFIDTAMKTAVRGFNDPTINVFNSITVDTDALEKLKDPNYNPFKVTNH